MQFRTRGMQVKRLDGTQSNLRELPYGPLQCLIARMAGGEKWRDIHTCLELDAVIVRNPPVITQGYFTCFEIGKIAYRFEQPSNARQVQPERI